MWNQLKYRTVISKRITWLVAKIWSERPNYLRSWSKEKNLGAVGAVAYDINGNIAAATSTGGMTNKAYGKSW